MEPPLKVLLVAVIIVILAVTLALVVAATRRRRKREEVLIEPPPPPKGAPSLDKVLGGIVRGGALADITRLFDEPAVSPAVIPDGLWWVQPDARRIGLLTQFAANARGFRTVSNTTSDITGISPDAIAILKKMRALLEGQAAGYLSDLYDVYKLTRADSVREAKPVGLLTRDYQIDLVARQVQMGGILDSLESDLGPIEAREIREFSASSYGWRAFKVLQAALRGKEWFSQMFKRYLQFIRDIAAVNVTSLAFGPAQIQEINVDRAAAGQPPLVYEAPDKPVEVLSSELETAVSDYVERVSSRALAIGASEDLPAATQTVVAARIGGLALAYKRHILKGGTQALISAIAAPGGAMSSVMAAMTLENTSPAEYADLLIAQHKVITLALRLGLARNEITLPGYAPLAYVPLPESEKITLAALIEPAAAETIWPASTPYYPTPQDTRGYGRTVAPVVLDDVSRPPLPTEGPSRMVFVDGPPRGAAPAARFATCPDTGGRSLTPVELVLFPVSFGFEDRRRVQLSPAKKAEVLDLIAQEPDLIVPGGWVYEGTTLYTYIHPRKASALATYMAAL